MGENGVVGGGRGGEGVVKGVEDVERGGDLG